MTEIYVPVLHIFENGNPFAGSAGSLRFLLKPSEERIHVTVWRGPYCLEKSQVETEGEFPLSAEGRQELFSWLESLREPE